jgi:hypothetical protein
MPTQIRKNQGRKQSAIEKAEKQLTSKQEADV